MSHLLFGVVFVYGRNVQAADEEVGRVDVAGALVSQAAEEAQGCLLYTSPSPRDSGISRMPSSA